MAKTILNNVWVRVNNVDLTNHVREVAIPMEVEQVEVTAMSDGSRQYLQGLRTERFEITFFQDFAASEVDQTLQPLYQSGSVFLVEVAPSGSTISATNPKYSGSCILTAYNPIAGAVGDASTTQVTFPTAGGTITRGTA